MKQKIPLSLMERETIICFNEWEPFAKIETFNSRLKRRLKELLEKRPNDVTHDHTDPNYGAETYIVPKTWLKIKPPPNYSQEERQKRAQSASYARTILNRSK